MAEPPLPPPLPSGRVVNVSGRGEMFVRERDGEGSAGPSGPLSGRRGPTILLLHGWTASADTNWFTIYDTAAQFGPVLALDHRGHGRGIRSEERFTLEAAADDAAALVDHLGRGPVVAVGYSMGGPIASLLWLRHPHLVAGLVLEATALEWRASWRERLVWRFLALMEISLRLGPHDGFVERWLRDAVEKSPELAPWRGWLKGEIRRGDAGAIADAGRALSRYDARPFAGRIDVPTTVVITTQDRLVRPRKQRALAKAIPGAFVVSINADHDAPVVRPHLLQMGTAQALRSVLDRLPAVTLPSVT